MKRGHSQGGEAPGAPGESLHLRKARVVDPAGEIDAELDIVIRDGLIEQIGKNLKTPAKARAVNLNGRIAVPGLIDLHSHLREPGEEYKEDIASASAAAAAGGFAALCAMPNTNPPNDCRAVTEFIRGQARAASRVRVYPVGAVSKGLKGETLSDIGDMKAAGVVALSDDGLPVMNAGLMRRAMEYARTFDLPVVQHAEDLNLSSGGSMNEGASATRAGLRGQPAQAEEVIVARDIALVELTGARYHVAHISTAAAIKLVRQARSRGLPVTCEATPHHLVLSDEACMGYDTCTKMSPPLRTKEDVAALREALADGTIEAVATDHAPHTSIEKQVEFDVASFGVIGLETALPIVLGLARDGILSLSDAVARLSAGPARLFGLPGGRLEEGGPADVTCIDPDKKWTVNPDHFRSKSRNTPFASWQVKGKAVMTIVAGKIVHEEA